MQDTEIENQEPPATSETTVEADNATQETHDPRSIRTYDVGTPGMDGYHLAANDREGNQLTVHRLHAEDLPYETFRDTAQHETAVVTEISSHDTPFDERGTLSAAVVDITRERVDNIKEILKTLRQIPDGLLEIEYDSFPEETKQVIPRQGTYFLISPEAEVLVQEILRNRDFLVEEIPEAGHDAAFKAMKNGEAKKGGEEIIFIRAGEMLDLADEDQPLEKEAA